MVWIQYIICMDLYGNSIYGYSLVDDDIYICINDPPSMVYQWIICIKDDVELS